jgi:hypothetical protein
MAARMQAQNFYKTQDRVLVHHDTDLHTSAQQQIASGKLPPGCTNVQRLKQSHARRRLKVRLGTQLNA